MDRPFTGDESAQAPAIVLSDVRPAGSDFQSAPAQTTVGTGGQDGPEPEQTTWTTWALAALVTACAILASVLLPQ